MCEKFGRLGIVSCNTMLKGLTLAGEIPAAYTLLSKMEWDGITPNDISYNSIMNSVGIDVCSEEVLLSTSLEVCLRLHERRRLQERLAAYGKFGGKPSQHLYGALIKASSVLKRVHKCRGYWQDMVQECAMMPNEVVRGCVLDALVCNGEVSEAVALFREWKPKVADRPTRRSRMKLNQPARPTGSWA